MRNSLLSLIELAIRVSGLLNVASFKTFVYEDGAYISIMTNKIIQPQKIISEAKGLEVCFYPMDDFIEVRIYEAIYMEYAL